MPKPTRITSYLAISMLIGAILGYSGSFLVNYQVLNKQHALPITLLNNPVWLDRKTTTCIVFNEIPRPKPDDMYFYTTVSIGKLQFEFQNPITAPMETYYMRISDKIIHYSANRIQRIEIHDDREIDILDDGPIPKGKYAKGSLDICN